MLLTLCPIHVRPSQEGRTLGSSPMQRQHSAQIPSSLPTAQIVSPSHPYLHHQDVPLGGQEADLILQLQDSPHQVHDVAVHCVVRAVQVGRGGWLDGLRASRATMGSMPRGQGGRDQHPRGALAHQTQPPPTRVSEAEGSPRPFWGLGGRKVPSCRCRG